MKPTLRLAAALSLLVAGAVHGQLHTIHTDHFRITYLPGTERTARRVAEVAEEIFPPLAAAFQYYDDYAPIHILVRDDSDFGNGAADHYSNTVHIWASNVDWEIRGEHEWIRNVLTHEITHVLTLDKARKKWPFRFALLQVSRFDSNPDITFDFPLYYLNTPTWWVEGVAQMGPYTFGYDTWDSHRDMVLRMAVLEDDLLSYGEMGSLDNRTGAYRGELVYNQGFALMVFITDQYGRDKANRLQEHIGALSFEVAIRRVLGISSDQLYSDWRRYLQERYGQVVAEVRGAGFFEGEALSRLNGGVLDYHPAYSPDGQKLAYITSEDRDYRLPKLAIYDFKQGRKKVLDQYVDTRVAWSPDGGEVVFVRTRGGHSDLFAYDLERDEEHRLSAGLRARDPHLSPDGTRIAFSRIDDGSANLCLVNRDGTGLRQLTNYEDGAQIYSPRWSPDGQWLLFSLFRGHDRDLAMMRSDSPPRPKDWGLRDRVAVPDSLQVFPDSLAYPAADSSGFRLVLASAADERDPCWLPDGSGFVFASDRSGIFNIFRYELASGAVTQLTNVVGGAFTPAVAADGRLVYAGYHSNDFDLYEVGPGAYGHGAEWDPPLAQRDYQSKPDLPELGDEYTVTPYSSRRVYELVPIVQVGPTFIGNQFGLNQVSGGFYLATGEDLEGDRFVAQGILGKNFRETTDLNTDFLLLYERPLRRLEGDNAGFNPTFFGAYRRREVDFIVNTSTVTADTFDAATLYPVPADTANLLVPDARQYRVEADTRKDRFKDIFDLFALGVDVPVGRRNQLFAQYVHRDYDEDWSLQHLRQRTQFFIIQDSTDISASLPPELVSQDTLLIQRSGAFTWYNGLDFFDAHDLTFAWQYRNIKPTEDYLLNATGRSLSLVYRYLKTTVADSLAQQSSPDGVPRDFFGADRKPLTANEYVAAYTERIGLPFYNRISFEFVGAYRNLRLKPSFTADGGFFEGRYYWPLRYYIGGLNFLSGYPYFTRSGSKLFYGRVAYGFPVFRRLRADFLNFTFAKLYTELFAETGAVGNFEKASLDEFQPKDFLADVGGELRLELFTHYRIPLRAFFQVAHPLNRSRLQREEAREQGLAPGDPEAPPKVDRLRYYFGLGFFPGDLLSAGRRIADPRRLE